MDYYFILFSIFCVCSFLHWPVSDVDVQFTIHGRFMGNLLRIYFKSLIENFASFSFFFLFDLVRECTREQRMYLIQIYSLWFGEDNALTLIYGTA